MKKIFILVILFFAVLCAQGKYFNNSTNKLPLSNLQKSLYLGDSNIDAKYYKLDIEVNPSAENIFGCTTIIFSSKTNNLSTINIDLSSVLTVDSITNNKSRLQYSHSSNVISIVLSKTLMLNENYEIMIYYHGQPQHSQSIGFGSFTFKTNLKTGKPWIYTLSEPYGTSDWFPCKDTPADKVDSCDIWVTVPMGLTVASNGILDGPYLVPGNKLIFKWKERYPIAQYLISLAIADYVNYKSYFKYSETDSMLVDNYVLQGYFQNSIKEELDVAISGLEIFTELYGEYPFIKEKYGQAQFDWGGGMEHQTITSLTLHEGRFNEGTIVHELAHQWFGDKLTCSTWNDIWLNESFATYSEALYYEKKYGVARYLGRINEAKVAALSVFGSIYVTDISSISNIFYYARSYQKGAVVLFMLRNIVGDDNFFNILKTYLSKPEFAYNSVETADFQSVAEQIYGQSLDYFFNEWIYGENFPKYKISYKFNYLVGNKTNVELKIDQLQNSNPVYFTMPIEINISNAEKDTTIVVFNDQQTQIFNLEVDFKAETLKFDKDGKILKSIQSIVRVTNNSLNLPKKFELEQNFPNPFNPVTTIKYSVPEKSNVKIDVFNSLGQLVATLVNEKKAAGKYSVKFNAENLTSGVYYYKFTAQDFSVTKKMLLLK